MNKHLFFLAAGALALTACTSEDVVDDVATSSRNAIQFENVVSKLTRADVEDLNTGTLGQFNVFGFYTMPGQPLHAHEIFNHIPVTKSGGSWSYKGDIKYWIPGATYYFYAYSCGSSDLKEGKGSFTIDMETGEKQAKDRQLEITGYICDYTHQHDLLFASETGYEAQTTNGAVAFDFQHILTKIYARFTNTFSPEYEVVIKKVTVDNICNQGDYSFTTGWKNVGRRSGQPLVYLVNPTGDGGVTADAALRLRNEKVVDNDNNEKQKTVDSMAAYVLPYKYAGSDDEWAYINITIDVVYKDKNKPANDPGDIVIPDKRLSARLNPIWEKGHTYVYNIELNANTINLGHIEFDVHDIAEWKNLEEDESSTSLGNY